MFHEIPWILISLIGILIIVLVLGYFLIRKMHKSGSSVFASIHKKAFISQFAIGLLCSLFGAFLMFNGELLGDNTTGIARIVGIVGICLIASSGPIGLALQRNNSK
ncbi:MAG: hypothetical protein JSU58_05330 [Dehalococcoidales bacterium]|nr:MAG: hypothetical protein JSU58_05330 [Dehalococcoidales bacterium]